MRSVRVLGTGLVLAAVTCMTGISACGGDTASTGNGGSSTTSSSGTGGGSTAACPPEQTECGAVCANTNTDNAHCGDCGTQCDPGEICNGAGVCELSCQAGLIDCNGTCIDPDTDETYCGASANCQAANAGTSCAAGEVCNGSGVCEYSCQAGFIDCSGTCIDPDTDESYCGASGDCQAANAGTSCAAGEICNGSGVCELNCQPGLIDCNGNCIDPTSNETYCGATGDCQNANSGVTCAAGEVCGGSGVCQLNCQPGLVNCNGTCIDPDTDESYCGASGDCQNANAGATCAAGEICNGSGVCQLNCQPSLIDCNGTCIDPDTDESYCGATGDCQNANAGATCAAGEICNGAGVCEVSCQAGLVDCNGTCIDPDYDPQYCGAGPDCGVNPGVVCPQDEACVTGSCVPLGCPNGTTKVAGYCWMISTSCEDAPTACASVGLTGTGGYQNVTWDAATMQQVATGLGVVNGGDAGCCVEFAWFDSGTIYTHNFGAQFYNWNGCFSSFPTVKACQL